MNAEQFYALKAQITKDLNRKLELSQKLSHSYPAVIAERVKTFKLDRCAEDQLSLLKEAVDFATSVNGTISHDTHDDGAGRVGYYSHTLISVKYKELIHEVSDDIVKSYMHKALKSMMGLKSYNCIDCKLMQLFKDGKIDWETLIASHKGGCSL